MKNTDPTISICLSICTLLIGFSLIQQVHAQRNIAWQKSIGTEYSDNALRIFNGEDGNIVIAGDEVHADFTGNLRNYMVIAKIDVHGQQIWKTYHDIAYETFSLPLDYYLGKQFYTEENGQKFINIIIHIADRNLLYIVSDATGDYYSYSEISSNVFTVSRDHVETVANVLCSIQQSCYGPDSLVVQHFDPNPIIGGNPLTWTTGLKQNIRTSPIQGHYDFNIQDITTDTNGNVYLLTQIDRWDFQFCTDCGDAFIDAYSEIFKFDTAGQLVKHFKLKTAKAVVSNMRFLSNADGKLIVRIDDINAAGTEIITSIYFVNSDLTLDHQFNLNQQYNHIALDKDDNLFACTNVYDPADPNIKGLSDVLVSKFNLNGVLQWKSYYGGNSFDYPKGIVVTDDGGLLFFANTESADFDIDENHGGQDMWLVKLEENTTTVQHNASDTYSIYPNPASDFINVFGLPAMGEISIFDLNGHEVLKQVSNSSQQNISVEGLPAGCYLLKIRSNTKISFMKIIKS
ncbi:MAG: T9SS type A sorting domain-containing protein [Saprospiraceae bacterium]